MSSFISLKEAERKAFRTTFQDGLWDIYLGLIFMMFGVGPLLQLSEEQDWILIVYYLPLFIAFWAAKKFITTPRIGRAKFSAARKRKLSRVRLILFFSVALGAVVYLLTANGDSMAGSIANLPIPILLFTGNILLIFGLGAYFLDFTRLYVYAVLLGLSFPAGHYLTALGLLTNATRPFLLSSGVMVLWGIFLFIRFLHENPRFDESTTSERGA